MCSTLKFSLMEGATDISTARSCCEAVVTLV
jgi:hypothetical protein